MIFILNNKVLWVVVAVIVTFFVLTQTDILSGLGTQAYGGVGDSSDWPDLVCIRAYLPEGELEPGVVYPVTAEFVFEPGSPEQPELEPYDLILFQDGSPINSVPVDVVESGVYSVDWTAVGGDHSLLIIADRDDRNPDNNRCLVRTNLACVVGDSNCDGIMTRSELGVVIIAWIDGVVSRDDLGIAISTWVMA